MGTTDAGDEVFRGHEEKILVSVRLRPLNDKEIARNDVSDWECLNDNTVIYKNANLSVSERSMYPTAYTFDRVFRNDCSTRKVYEQGAKEVALCVVSGINSTVFAYGQTSSGKTYTMTGITEYTIADIYDYIKKHPEREFLLKFSAIEIYNESVRDLLCADSTPLRLLDDPERGTVVEKLTEETVRDWNHVRELLSICEAQRQIGETSLNETSSRSHQVIKLTIESSSRELLGRENPSTLVAAVSFVDLAGSERASQSLSAGTRLKEGCHINRSLLTLGSVIRKLSKGRTGHIPFRDSKLTRILQSSLGGNARTAIICTMSPARTHVEQSRNTLLFASCAKEVTSNAQVNVVMSDKALVKHLQRELARLESEIKSPGSTFTTSNYAELLREKDFQIEKMEKEIKDLTMQREIAQSQVEELLRLVDDQNSLLRVGLGQYPSLRVRESPRNGVPEPETSMFADSDSLDYTVRILATPQYSDGGSDTNSESSESRSVQLIDVQENIMQNNTPPRISISSSRFSETDSCHGWEDMEERSSGTSDDLCKEVRCIETEESESRTGRHVESDCLSTKGNTKDSAPINIPNGERSDKEELSSAQSEEDGQCNSPSLKENEGIGSKPLIEDREVVSSPLKEDGEVALSPLKEDEEVVLSPLKEDREVVSSPLKEDKELTSPDLKEAKELSSIQLFNVHSPDKTSSPHDPTEDLSANGILQLTRSRSCKAMLMASMPFQRSDKEENNENTPPNWSEKDFTGRPDGFVRKFSALNYGADLERSSRHGSKSSKGSIAGIELESQNEYASVDKNEPRDNTFTTGTKGVTALQPSKQVTDDSVNESEEKANECPKNVKDVGLDPIEEAFSSPSNWPSEFKRLQREIIKLWHTCSVSLVHRTYFFLLFKGDPTDSIYMEVELRRLSFLEETFSQGSQTVEFGHTLSHSSSLKSLHRERHMLSRQMRKKLSEQERENLYLKWGIRLKDKNRRLQLAYRLWTNTEDMGHIADSAIIIAKLVRHIEPDKFPKEIFGLNFAPPPTRTRRSYSLTRSLISLL